MKQIILGLILFFLNGAAWSEGTKLSTIEPKSVCNFLAEQGMESQGWGELGDGSYGCPSYTKEFGRASASLEKNDITFYVSSKSGKLVELKLFLNVNNPANAQSANAELLKSVRVLIFKLGGTASKDLEASIASTTDYAGSDSDINYELVKMPWGNRDQYSLKFVIK